MPAVSFPDIDAYLAVQPPGAAKALKQLRKLLRDLLPGAEETISYQMPAFRRKRVIVYFAAFREHYSIFVRPQFLNPFRDELTDYVSSKSGFQIPYSAEMPVALISRIVKYADEKSI